MTRVAAVDCGTNTIKLLVADLVPATGGTPATETALAREVRIVRLGQGVDGTGRLADEALARVFAATEEYAGLVRDLGAERVRFVATSAVRDAANADVFVRGVRERLGVTPEVVSGDEEARLAFTGATRALPDVPSPVAVLDIGGGSTELVLGTAAEGVRAARSLDVGSVRVTERLMPSDPPTADEVAAATGFVDAELDTLPAYGVRVDEARTLVGVAGTLTTLATVLQGLTSWDREAVHHARFAVEDVHALVQRLLGLTVAEREALGIPAGRSDVIGAGALVLDRVLLRSAVTELLVSDADILDGIAWSLVGDAG